MTAKHLHPETIQITMDGLVVLTDSDLAELERDFTVGVVAGGANDRCNNNTCSDTTNTVCQNTGCPDTATNTACVNSSCQNKDTSDDS